MNPLKTTQSLYAKKKNDFLADIQHEFRISRNSVRSRPAECQCEQNPAVIRRRCRTSVIFLAGSTSYRHDCPADYRALQRPYMVQARQETSLLPDRSHSGLPDAVSDAELAFPCRLSVSSADRRRYPYDAGCVAQRGYGAIPGLSRRQAALGAENPRLLDADFPYRYRRCRRCRASLCTDQLVRHVQHPRRSRRRGTERENGLLHRFGSSAALRTLDRHQHQRISSRVR